MKNKVLLAIISVLALALGIETICFISYKHDYDKRVDELENKKENTQQKELDDSGY